MDALNQRRFERKSRFDELLQLHRSKEPPVTAQAAGATAQSMQELLQRLRKKGDKSNVILSELLNSLKESSSNVATFFNDDQALHSLIGAITSPMQLEDTILCGLLCIAVLSDSPKTEHKVRICREFGSYLTIFLQCKSANDRIVCCQMCASLLHSKSIKPRNVLLKNGILAELLALTEANEPHVIEACMSVICIFCSKLAEDDKKDERLISQYTAVVDNISAVISNYEYSPMTRSLAAVCVMYAASNENWAKVLIERQRMSLPSQLCHVFDHDRDSPEICFPLVRSVGFLSTHRTVCDLISNEGFFEIFRALQNLLTATQIVPLRKEILWALQNFSTFDRCAEFFDAQKIVENVLDVCRITLDRDAREFGLKFLGNMAYFGRLSEINDEMLRSILIILHMNDFQLQLLVCKIVDLIISRKIVANYDLVRNILNTIFNETGIETLRLAAQMLNNKCVS